MRFSVKTANENILVLIRKLGYAPKEANGEEFNCVRYLSGREYPRFHLFIKQDKDKNLLSFNLHLDQKKASYKNSPAHSGEYEGKLVEVEKERIIKAIEG